jgi:hypothetical protein
MKIQFFFGENNTGQKCGGKNQGPVEYKEPLYFFKAFNCCKCEFM